MPTTTAGKQVAAEVRAEMARQNRGQAALASLLGLSQAAVSRRLQGLVEFDVGELLKVADFLGRPPGQFLGREDVKELAATSS